MAWTAPRTWTTGEIVTAAHMNTHVRDNLLESAPAKATTAGDVFYATAANTIARLGIGAAGQALLVNAGATAPFWGAAVPLVTRRTADGPISTGDTVLDNDGVLLQAVLANEVWHLNAVLKVSANAAGGLKLGLSAPTGTTAFAVAYGLLEDNTLLADANDGIIGDADGLKLLNAIVVATLEAIVIVGGTAGTIHLQTSQYNSSVFDTRLLTGSTLIATKLA